MVARRRIQLAVLLAALGLVAAIGLAAAAPAEAGYGRYLPRKHGGCPHQNQVKASEHAERKAMRCLVQKVRRARHLHSVRGNRALTRAADHKASDVRNCGFSHTACGRGMFYWDQRYGYAKGRYRLGENLYWGTGRLRSPRMTMRAWLRSDPHRRTLFGHWRHMGAGLSRGSFLGRSNVAVWVLHLGCHC